jgi:copper chaperone CopZ
MVVSFTPGRLRLRFKELKEDVIAENVKTRLSEAPGITKVEINKVTGSILIEYNQTILPTEKLIETGKQDLANYNIKLDEVFPKRG